MRKLIIGAAAAALLLPAVSSAGGPPVGRIGVYATQSGYDFGSGFGGDDSGLGFGVHGWGMLNQNWFLHGEFQQATTDDFEVDLQSLRAGGGYAGSLGGGAMWLALAEYVDFGSDLDQSGFGVHGGVVLGAGGPFSFSGTVGYLTTDDTDGLELNAGAHYSFNESWGGFLDYRIYMGSVDPSGDIDLTDLRFGATYTFH